ncbi:MAG: LptM family lipoprotein [Thalassotalea sp.]
MCAQKLKYFVSLLVIVTLTGCGLKGSLYETPTKPINGQTSQAQTVEKQEK